MSANGTLLTSSRCPIKSGFGGSAVVGVGGRSSGVRQVQQYYQGDWVMSVENLVYQSRPSPRGGSIVRSSSKSNSAIACSFSTSLDPSRLGGRLSSQARFSFCILMRRLSPPSTAEAAAGCAAPALSGLCGPADAEQD